MNGPEADAWDHSGDTDGTFLGLILTSILTAAHSQQIGGMVQMSAHIKNAKMGTLQLPSPAMVNTHRPRSHVKTRRPRTYVPKH